MIQNRDNYKSVVSGCVVGENHNTQR
jgi:hypothetical protein